MRKADFLEQLNPLRNLTPAQAVRLIESGMRGDYTLLQWYYHTIEQADPDLLALVERRTGAIMAMDWNTKDTAEDGGGGESAAAKDLRAAYNRIENLQEAIEHLALATFRGYSICQLQDEKGVPAPPGVAVRCHCIQHWNVVRDGRAGAWKYNPDALQQGFSTLPAELEFDPVRDHLLIREVARPVDRIALTKFIRSNYSQKAWADFVERCAEQGVLITLPPDLSEEDLNKFLPMAEDASRGGHAVLPNGATATFSNNQRGPIPFEAHMRFLQEQLVLAGTGGLLTMLTGATGIGQGATGAHEDAFRTLAQSEAKKISEVFQKQFDKRLGSGTAYFELAYAEETDVGAIIDHAAKLKTAGYRVGKDYLSGKTGYELELDESFAGRAGGEPFATPGIPPFPRTVGGTNLPAASNREAGAQDALEKYLAKAEALMGLEDPAERARQARALMETAGDVLADLGDDGRLVTELESFLKGAALFGLMGGAR